ncbi:hypothetical protein [Bythopirellula polymerisocia]|uniref:HNH nuclease domain-containing protein n=1 Tax=Bythopirellula polymerisocia TaxID=2528003 RepID=A0A5C6CV65_9BACT|nr:hypothetical protein [Bythopirellula polymerisocia]TWU27554.1 hypothetical protein Pla144_23310 [Bythopirellula polymerisocia]
MTTRKRIPDDTEKEVLLQSRRRCCLCFWLEGIDEVVKGQIAHLDQDPSNSSFENLAFLCFDHHDEYDGKTKQAKGLKESEVTKWRDELYKEMEYRFRSVKARKLELRISNYLMVNVGVDFKLRFRLKNVGQASARNITVSIRLQDNISAESPKKQESKPKITTTSGVSRLVIPELMTVEPTELPDAFGFYESEEDFFEEVGGRVASIDPLGPMNLGLLPDHSIWFEGLGFHITDYPPGTDLVLGYRIDAEDMDSVKGTLQGTIPIGAEWVLQQPEEFGLPRSITLQEVKQIIAESKQDVS